MDTWPNKKNNFLVQIDVHTGIFMVGPLPTPGIAAHIAWGTLEIPWLGSAFGENKGNYDEILADGSSVVSRGHEPKLALLPHINLFLYFVTVSPNLLIPLLILGSSSKCEFAVGSVQGPHGSIAVSFKETGINLGCNDPFNMPTSMTHNNGTVVLGFTAGDMIVGLLCIGFDGLKSFIENLMFEKVVGKILPKGLIKNQLTTFFKKIGLPTTFKSGAEILSFPEELVSQTMQGVGKYFYGKTIGGSWGDSPIKAPFIEPFKINDVVNTIDFTGFLTGEAITGSGGMFETIGALIDGRAEILGPPPGYEPGPTPMPLPATATPTGTPTATPTATPIATPISAPPTGAPIPTPAPTVPVPSAPIAPSAPIPAPAPSAPVPAPAPIAPVPAAPPTETPPATPTPTPTGPPKPQKK